MGLRARISNWVKPGDVLELSREELEAIGVGRPEAGLYVVVATRRIEGEDLALDVTASRLYKGYAYLSHSPVVSFCQSESSYTPVQNARVVGKMGLQYAWHESPVEEEEPVKKERPDDGETVFRVRFPKPEGGFETHPDLFMERAKAERVADRLTMANMPWLPFSLGACRVEECTVHPKLPNQEEQQAGS